MSSKKLPRASSTPGSGLKSVKNKPPPSQRTVTSKTVPKFKESLNTTAMSNFDGHLIPSIATTDWDLECDLAYSEYLRTLLARDILHASINSQAEAMDDQLCRQAEFLQKAISEKNNQEIKIRNMERQKDIDLLLSLLDEAYNKVLEILENYNVNKNLTTCIDALENACNKLYLKNVKSFKGQEDYDNFTILLDRCALTMKKLKTSVGNTEEMLILGGRIKTFLQLQEEFIEKRKLLVVLQMYIGCNLFKVWSDEFSRIRSYDESII